MVINGYSLTSELQNKNSGFSKWAFATKNGKEYFIKELHNRKENYTIETAFKYSNRP